jgi:anti-sigma-K factor RskA
MNDKSLKDHLTIVGQLPDYVLGKLDETSLRRIDRHVETCPTCRREAANAMVVLGLLSPVAPPAASTRAALLSRAATLRPEAGRSSREPAQVAARADCARQAGPFGDGPRRLRELWKLHVRGKTVAAAAVVLLSGLLGWSSLIHNAGAGPQESLNAAMNDQMAAYPLDDSDLSVPAAGVVFADPGSHQVYLVANGLPLLPHNQRYQVWLFTADDKQESAGLLAVGSQGDLRAFLETPEPFADYVGVALTAEPVSGSEFPTSDLVLGGSFAPEITDAGSMQA